MTRFPNNALDGSSKEGILKRSEEQWQAFSESLSEALELSESEREPWLLALAGRNPTLAAEISSALSARSEHHFSDFLAEPPLVANLDAVRAGLAGRHVGPYLIEAEIGRGGMGSVWRARRADDRYDGTVAIKFLHASWNGRHGEQRFRSEGRFLARLDHPNIARLIDAGVLDAAHPYLVLEHVDGEPIDAYCERHQLSVEARVRLFLSVLAAVAHAHSHLIVHRDIKPSNIFVTESGTVKLLDFGIAKLLDDEAPAATRSGGIALTPQYAAPEQLLGQPVTTSTDVYALGLVLYVLLVGRHPFVSEKASQAELIQGVLTRDAPRASAVAAETSRRRLRGDLDNILAKALKKSPTDRYASVGAFADDLEHFLAHEPVLARPDTVTYLATKFVRRHRGAVIAGLIVAVGLIATSSFAVVQLFRARAERDLAMAEAERANAESELTQFLGGDTSSQAPLDTAHERLDRARQFVTRRFQEDQPLAARLLIDVSSQYVDIGDERTGAEIIVQAEDIGRRFNDLELLGTIACLRAEDLTIAHNLPDARVQLAAGRAKMALLSRISPGLRAECASAAAFIWQADGNFAAAATELRGAVEYLDQLGMHKTSRYTSLANDFADALLMAGDFRGAWQVDDGVIRLMNETGRANTPPYFAYASAACMSLRLGGQPRRALQFSAALREEALRRAPDIKLPYYFDACGALSQIAVGGESSQAEAALLRAAQEAEQAGMMTVVAGYRSDAVLAALDRGDVAAADARWQTLAPVEQSMLAAQERGLDIVHLLLTHARLDLAHGHPGDGMTRMVRAAELISLRQQTTNRDARPVALLTAQLLLSRNSNAQALHQAQLAVDLARAEAIDAKSSAWIGEALVWRARAEAALGQASAAATAEEALAHLRENLDARHPLLTLAAQLTAHSL